MFFSKKEKVNGKIIRFELVNGQHIPVFLFITRDGTEIESPIIDDSPLEEVIDGGYLNEILSEPLPIENVDIVYKKDDPKDFYARYL